MPAKFSDMLIACLDLDQISHADDGPKTKRRSWHS
jgi:hypothetical protein